MRDLLVGLRGGDDDGGDDAGGDGGQDIVSVHFAPLIAARGPAKVTGVPVDALAAVPVVVIDASASAPFPVMDIATVVVVVAVAMVAVVVTVILGMMVVVVILGEGGHAGQGKGEGGNNHRTDKGFHGGSSGCQIRAGGVALFGVLRKEGFWREDRFSLG